MKSIIFIIIGLIILSVLLGIAGKKFDNATAEFPFESNGDLFPSQQGYNEGDADNSNDPEHIRTYDFTVVDQNGQDVKLSDLNGKPMVVLFFMSKLETSRQELAAVNEVYDRYKDDVEFIVVSIVDGEHETLDSAKSYLASMNYSFPAYFDVYNEAYNNFLLYGFPNVSRTFLFYADGSFAGSLQIGYVLSPNTIEQGISLISQ